MACKEGTVVLVLDDTCYDRTRGTNVCGYEQLLVGTASRSEHHRYGQVFQYAACHAGATEKGRFEKA